MRGRFEKDDVIKGAGRMMVQNLAGSLALVTCKEPLRHNMVNQLRGIIQKYFAAAFANEVMDNNALEPAVQMIAQDNLVRVPSFPELERACLSVASVAISFARAGKCALRSIADCVKPCSGPGV